MSAMLRRHDLLRIDPNGWREMLGASSSVDALPSVARRLVEDWARRGWPVIVRRRDSRDADRAIAVGLPLPPALGKLRLGFSLPGELRADPFAAVTIEGALQSAPAELRPQLRAIAALGERSGLQPTIFGSLLWQHITGLAYLRPGSDIDVLWPTPQGGCIRDLLDGLASIDDEGPARIDGEIVLTGGGGVNWRELRAGMDRAGGDVLLKTIDRAELICARSLVS